MVPAPLAGASKSTGSGTDPPAPVLRSIVLALLAYRQFVTTVHALEKAAVKVVFGVPTIVNPENWTPVAPRAAGVPAVAGVIAPPTT